MGCSERAGQYFAPAPTPGYSRRRPMGCYPSRSGSRRWLRPLLEGCAAIIPDPARRQRRIACLPARRRACGALLSGPLGTARGLPVWGWPPYLRHSPLLRLRSLPARSPRSCCLSGRSFASSTGGRGGRVGTNPSRLQIRSCPDAWADLAISKGALLIGAIGVDLDVSGGVRAGGGGVWAGLGRNIP
jgi:hypothetical protein